MSGERIIAGLDDALAWAKGDKRAARIVKPGALTRPQAMRLAGLWGYKGIVGVPEGEGYLEATDAALLRRGYLAPTGERARIYGGGWYAYHTVTPAGLTALAAYLAKRPSP